MLRLPTAPHPHRIRHCRFVSYPETERYRPDFHIVRYFQGAKVPDIIVIVVVHDNSRAKTRHLWSVRTYVIAGGDGLVVVGEGT